MASKIKLATVFSGIGSVEWAMKRKNLDYEIKFACDNGDIILDNIDVDKELANIKRLSTILEMKEYEDELYSEIKRENFVKKSYMENYSINEINFHRDIRLLDGSKYKGDVDLLVGGSPCQSFSIMGYQKGLEDARGTLFYEFARIVNEVKPKVFIYENVQGIKNHDQGNTWTVITSIFNSIGYDYTCKILNSKDFGIPQNRNRLFVIGFRNKKYLKKLEEPQKTELEYTMQDFLIEKCKFGEFEYGNIKDDPGTVEEKYYLSDKVLKHVMSEGTKNYKVKPKTDLSVARPLLATMHKMHRAGVDNYVTINNKVRKLTPRECLRLMGYGDDFKQVVSNTQMYKQAGNSIVVDIFIELLDNLINTGVFER
ncbi:MAG: DNA (cytosine-5-)-methyltransferase [Longicatena sp.]